MVLCVEGESLCGAHIGLQEPEDPPIGKAGGGLQMRLFLRFFLRYFLFFSWLFLDFVGIFFDHETIP